MRIFGDFEIQTRWMIRLLWVLIVANAAAAVSGVAEYRLVVDLMGERVDYDMAAAADSNDFRQKITTVIQVAAWVVVAVVALLWIRQASLNARALGAEDMRFTPNWSVGWYLIPIMNLWKPYQVMIEIMRASGEPVGDEPDQSTGMVTLWWVVWLVVIALNRVSASMAQGARDLEDFRIASLAAIAVDVAAVVLCFAFMDVVREIARRQSARAAAIGSPVPARV